MDLRKKKAAVEFYSIATDDEEDDDGMKCHLMGGWKKWTRRKRRWKPIIVDSGADASIFLGYMLKQGRKAYRIVTTSLSFVSLACSLANMLERLYHCFLSVPGLGLGLQSCTKLVVVKSSPSGLPPAWTLFSSKLHSQNHLLRFQGLRVTVQLSMV